MMHYHAHVFYHLNEKSAVLCLHQQLQATLPDRVFVGRLLDRAVGPLPQPMFQIEYTAQDAVIVEQQLRHYAQDYSVLIHPLMEDELLAHTTHAIWLGQALVLNLEAL